jgi:hypothetical protein
MTFDVGLSEVPTESQSGAEGAHHLGVSLPDSPIAAPRGTVRTSLVLEMKSVQALPGLARLVPDEPQWIDLKGLLVSGRCDIWAEADPDQGFVALSRDYPFASLFGKLGTEVITAATNAGLAASSLPHLRNQWQLLATPQNRSLVESALPGWSRAGIALLRPEKPAERPEPDPSTEIRLLPNGHHEAGFHLDHVPEASRYEISLDWVSRRPMAVGIVSGLPVAFCYAAFTTERLWDVSVETLEQYRRRGLAAACYLALAAHMGKSNRTPAWGAMLDNPASLGLAAKLGFVRDSTLERWSPPQRYPE